MSNNEGNFKLFAITYSTYFQTLDLAVNIWDGETR